MKTTEKSTLVSIVGLFLLLFIGTWLFNHVSGWLGFVIIIVGLYLGIKFIVSLIKELKRKEK